MTTFPAPKVSFVGGGVRLSDERSSAELSVHDRLGPWTLIAVLRAETAAPIAVVERVADAEGTILYLDESGVLLSLGKTLEPTAAPQPGDSCELVEATLPGSDGDILRATFLAADGDPSMAAVAAAIPPIRRIADGEAERPHTFVGSPDSLDVLPIYYDSLRATNRVSPSVVAPAIREVIESQRIEEGLIGGWLPAVRFVYRLEDHSHWESVTFADPVRASFHSQPVWYRYTHVGADGRLLEVRYVDSYLPYPVGEAPEASEFYEALLKLHDYWSVRLDGGTRVELPERWITDFVRHSFVLDQITRTGDRPRYGVVDRVYGAPEHDGFQDTLNASAAAYLEWGRADVARRYLENYFEDFVRPDGTIDYRGPELGQYARMLTMLAQYHAYAGDESLADTHRVKVDAITGILLDRRELALDLPPENPAHGLIHGRHEADISFDTPTLGTADYERPYFSNSAEAARGLRDLGMMWSTIGSRRGDSELSARGARLQSVSAELSRALEHSIERSWIERDGKRRLPLFAGATRLHLDAPYRSTPESYDENRVWGELLHSGMVRRALVEHVVDSAAKDGDSIFGIFGNRKLLVSFTGYGIAYSLVQHDLVREFLLFFYAHAAHLHTRGTWTVLECADPDRDRAQHWPYCLPGQLTIPALVRWMLVFEDPQSGELWLAKATPRSWLDDGEVIAVDHAPTAQGSVAYRISSDVGRRTIQADIDLGSGRSTSTHLRLRAPDPLKMYEVSVDGVPWRDFDPELETVRLAAGTTRASVLVRYEVEACGPRRR
ncbi:MAG: hypothetical protein ABWY57_07480 [Mycetocola sp.]